MTQRLANTLLLFPALAAIIAIAGFLLRIPITPAIAPITLLICALYHARTRQPKAILKSLLTLTLILTATLLIASCFSYAHGYDAIMYHTPATLLLAKGWNPLTTIATPDLLQQFNLPPGSFRTLHAIHLPKAPWIAAATLTSLTGITSTNIAIGLLLTIPLCYYAFHFSTQTFKGPPIIHLLFTLAILTNPRISSLLAGLNDYHFYTLLMIAAFTLLTPRTPTPILPTGIALALLINTRFAGIPATLILLTAKLIQSRTLKIPIRPLIITLLSLFLLSLTPYLTNILYSGSPLYPQHSLNPAIPAIDITSDFTGNPHAQQMGYFGRTIYAWFSQTAATAYYAWKTHNPAFDPIFTVHSGLQGFGPLFRLILTLSIIIMAINRRHPALPLFLTLLATSLLLPTPYIGYTRYVPQITTLPIIALFTLPWMFLIVLFSSGIILLQTARAGIIAHRLLLQHTQTRLLITTPPKRLLFTTRPAYDEALENKKAPTPLINSEAHAHWQLLFPHASVITDPIPLHPTDLLILVDECRPVSTTIQ